MQWECTGGAVEVQWKCSGSTVGVEVEGEVEAEVEVKSALRANLCGGFPRVEDPATLIYGIH